MKKQKTNHIYRICGKGLYYHEKSPIISIHGKWLRDYGFDIGDYIECHCEDGKIIITKTNPPEKDENRK